MGIMSYEEAKKLDRDFTKEEKALLYKPDKTPEEKEKCIPLRKVQMARTIVRNHEHAIPNELGRITMVVDVRGIIPKDMTYDKETRHALRSHARNHLKRILRDSVEKAQKQGKKKIVFEVMSEDKRKRQEEKAEKLKLKQEQKEQLIKQKYEERMKAELRKIEDQTKQKLKNIGG